MVFLTGNDRKLSAHVCHFHTLTFFCILLAMVYCCGQKLYGEGSITFKRQIAYWIGRLIVMALSFNIFSVMAHLQMVNEEPFTNQLSYSPNYRMDGFVNSQYYGSPCPCSNRFTCDPP
ncbi:uncharacterized protein LOC136043989 [Artemia franciscana]|uniref:uncharacterized protein LOC136043989 n=1 Tax=Artemia franciscana TaxID=6661 RepID=UPI0032DB4B1C